MPVLTEKEIVEVAHGMVCDCCGKRDEIGFNDFVIDYVLGYDSPADQSRVKAALCDACLVRILLEHVPGAAFSDSDGTPVSRDEMARNLAERGSFGGDVGGGI